MSQLEVDLREAVKSAKIANDSIRRVHPENVTTELMMQLKFEYARIVSEYITLAELVLAWAPLIQHGGDQTGNRDLGPVRREGGPGEGTAGEHI